jgi:hypothetical protein
MEAKAHHRYRHAALGELSLPPRYCLLWGIAVVIVMGVLLTG